MPAITTQDDLIQRAIDVWSNYPQRGAIDRVAHLTHALWSVSPFEFDEPTREQIEAYINRPLQKPINK